MRKAVNEQRWQHALWRNTEAVEAFLTTLARIPSDRWLQEPAPGKWSPATLTLHVTDAYEMGLRALAGGTSMRLRIPRWKAWFYRTALLPQLLRKGEFPRVRAPREIQPDLAAARVLTRETAMDDLRTKARAAGDAFRTADRSPDTPKLTHAYFGALPPHLALRFLTAHTQHHTKGLVRSLST